MPKMFLSTRDYDYIYNFIGRSSKKNCENIVFLSPTNPNPYIFTIFGLKGVIFKKCGQKSKL